MTDLTPVDRRAMRDVLALSVLPVLWQTLEPKALAESVADVLWSLLDLEFVHLTLQLHAEVNALEVTRGAVPSPGLPSALDVHPQQDSFLDVHEHRVARWQVHASAGQLLIAVGSRDEANVAAHERLIVSMVMNHAKAAFQSACSRIRVAPRRGLAPWQIKRVTTFMTDHLDAQIALDDLAALVDRSRHHFCKAFRRATDTTPGEWLTTARMHQARELLADPHASVTEIALAVGYSTPSAFSAAFRRVVGMTPSEFRRSGVPSVLGRHGERALAGRRS